jgi:predicted amidohydrolase YtcJ
MHSDKNLDLPVLFAGGLEISLIPNSSPTKAFIDDVVPDRPVVLLSATEHEGFLNAKAMEMLVQRAMLSSPIS